MSGIEDGADSGLSGEALEYARELHKATREELIRADTKAALLLAASGIAIGALLNGLLAGKWSPSQLANSVEWVWWVGVLAAAGALFCLAVAIYPRTARRGARPKLVAYYGDVVSLPRDLLEETLATTPKKVDAALVDQILQVSQIVSTKFLLIRIALWLFLAAVLLSVVSVLLNLVVPQP